jgi:hemerythrin-like domain-containing protein
MPEGANVTTELQQEHAEIERLVRRVASLEPGPERTGLVRETAARFLTHARAEERYLFPAFRRYLPEGAQEAVAQERRVYAVRNLVESLVRTADEDAETYDALVGQLVVDIQRHIEQQDTVLLPQLLDACPGPEVNTIGRQLRYAIHDERDPGE